MNLLSRYTCLDHICVVDNASPNESFEELKRIRNNGVDIIKTTHNGGYGYGNNYGIRYLHDTYKSKYILLCNPDVTITEDAIIALESFLKNNSDYMIVAPFMRNKEGVKQRNTAFKIGNVISYILSYELLLSKIFRLGEYKCIEALDDRDKYDVDAVAGSLFMFDAEKMIKHGMYDENVFLYCEERILGIKCKKAGLNIALLPRYSFIHDHAVTINKTIGSEKAKRSMMIESALYVIKNYYDANHFVIIFAKVVLTLSVIEITLIEKVKRFK